MNPLAEAAAALLGGQLQAWHSLHGGDLAQVLCVELRDGREAVVKGGPAPRAEAEMLAAIAQSGAPAPAVLASSDEVLVLERLPAGGGPDGAWPSLGDAVATLHRTTGPRYGWSQDYAFGAVRIENAWADEWPRFFAERRLLVHAPEVPSAIARRLEALARGIDERLPAAPPASLLHGDLWSGNVLASGARVTGLIDPACYYGHGEVDLAMLSLFGRPTQAFFESYVPLEPGHEQRLGIYQLWPALVHLRLFGSGYRSMVERLLSAAGV